MILNLRKKVDFWVEQGAISRSQGAQLLALEENAGAGQVFSSFLLLAAFLIGIGMISLIAANWREIPDAVKLTVDYLILGGIGVALLQRHEKADWWAEGLAFLFALFCLATIGLNSQVFHLSGKWYEGGLLWSVPLLPLVCFAKRLPLPLIVTMAFYVCIFAKVADMALFRDLVNRSPNAAIYFFTFVAVAAATISRLLMGDSPMTKAIRACAVAGMFSGLIMAELKYRGHYHLTAGPLVEDYIWGWGVAALAALVVARSPEYRKKQKLLLLLAGAFFTFSQHLPLIPELPPAYFAAATVLTLLSIAFFLASIGQWRMFHTLLVLVGLRFLILYFEALGGLARTGLGLILSGLGIVGALVAFRKLSPLLRSWVEEKLE